MCGVTRTAGGGDGGRRGVRTSVISIVDRLMRGPSSVRTESERETERRREGGGRAVQFPPPCTIHRASTGGERATAVRAGHAAGGRRSRCCWGVWRLKLMGQV